MKIFPSTIKQEEEILEIILNEREEIIIYDTIYKKYTLNMIQCVEIFIEEYSTNKFITFLKELSIIK
ncbi:hypothetical protein NEPAR06_2466 [Nematocida parisii]|uniref:Uncharacterized protein n=1 Tax=Nematocida parisii (strain ERTm3) TaxID=935791 RepID=I3EH01_NEMP3|nr:uncharacterized protein NEPG_00270 [Nematocida parisii ERTm1]EIJ88498.1 hypothetical protein NEQG_01188 [Nematocida parisii ERTm3]KAI5131585.1 hypothetical protein NEPAR03_2484 [Nematocida parisii]EIJ94746.1 hypothetical protein NEPG_00270 [Nematocida parisii ERTm1]KAI5131605.1 hypothetical protein NEPAR08_2524 [Nematocida parisii]KAI5145837.1 hypothetical protein NEPAR04_2516 [Nematocida parisii]|eukprot:XP_013058102.1 hypothetical protein NEPG_00270 [Nematocida parisii ERTm1]